MTTTQYLFSLHIEEGTEVEPVMSQIMELASMTGVTLFGFEPQLVAPETETAPEEPPE